MSTDSGQDDLPKILARAFLHAWERYCESDLAGKHCEEVAQPFLKGLLVEFAIKRGDRRGAASRRQSSLLAFTNAQTGTVQTFDERRGEDHSRREVACAFLHQARPRKISPPMGMARTQMGAGAANLAPNSLSAFNPVGRISQLFSQHDVVASAQTTRIRHGDQQ